jgi:hypothetical protein
MRLFDEGISPDEVFRHPRHQTAQKSLPELIVQLWACANVKDRYEFQQALLTHVLELENDCNAFSKAVKRMRARKSPQPGGPEPQSGLDPARLPAVLPAHRPGRRPTGFPLGGGGEPDSKASGPPSLCLRQIDQNAQLGAPLAAFRTT